jgi:hypothetical protein
LPHEVQEAIPALIGRERVRHVDAGAFVANDVPRFVQQFLGHNMDAAIPVGLLTPPFLDQGLKRTWVRIAQARINFQVAAHDRLHQGFAQSDAHADNAMFIA